MKVKVSYRKEKVVQPDCRFVQRPVGISFSRVQTLPAEKRNCANLEPELSQSKLERSKTERQRTTHILPSESVQIFDNKIPVQQKALLN